MSDETKAPTVTVNFGTVITALDGKPFKAMRFDDDGKRLPASELADLTLGQVCVDALQQPVDPKSLGAVSPKMLRERQKTQHDLARRIYGGGKWPTLDLSPDEAVFLADLIPLAYPSPAVCGPALALLGG